MHLNLVMPRWWKFFIVGGICFATNIAVLYLGVDVAGLHYLAAMGISIVVAYSLGWYLNRVWTFRSRAADTLAEYSRYILVNLGGMVGSCAFMWLLVSGLGVHYIAASAGIAAMMAMINFIAHRDWTFRNR